MQLFKHLRIFAGWNTVFHQLNFRRQCDILYPSCSNNSFRVLYWTKQVFRRSFEISGSLTLNKAFKFGKVYPRNKQFYQLQKLNRKFFKIRPFCQRSHTDNFKSERLSSFGASAKRLPIFTIYYGSYNHIVSCALCFSQSQIITRWPRRSSTRIYIMMKIQC